MKWVSSLVKIFWRGKKRLHFCDIPLNAGFSNAGPLTQNAVYIKVQNTDTSKFYMMEVMTGMLYPPTRAEVRPVEIEIQIHEDKPILYNDERFASGT